MGQIGELIVQASRRVRHHAELLLKGIEPRVFASRPRVGGTVIETNHPAFIFGHLSLYPATVLKMLELDASAATPPARWSELFAPGRPCEDDPGGTIYPPKDELTGTFFRVLEAAQERVCTAEDAAFTKLTPDERYRTFFPTVGAAALSMLNNHMSFHLGQVSAWRRCMGLPAAQ